MIAKCVVVLAIVAQINGYVCNSNYGSSNSGNSGNTRNIIAKGKYPIALCNCGPAVDKRIPVSTSHIQAPVQVKPTVRLPCQIPSQKTVAHSCTCYKTVVRPRVHDQYITVPSVQRYLETTHQPVVENVHYEGYPVNCQEAMNEGAISTFQVTPVSMSSESSQAISSASSGSQAQVLSPVVFASSSPVFASGVSPVSVATSVPVYSAGVQVATPVAVSASVPVTTFSVGSMASQHSH